MNGESETQPEGDELRELITEDVVTLIRHLRCSQAPGAALAEATEHIRSAVDVLQPWLEEGQGWSTLSIAERSAGLPWQEEDITNVMPYSPVSGKRNPVAPPMRIWRDGDNVRGEVTFTPTYAGPPDSVHGGIIAAVFDEVLAMANVVSGNAGFTGTLTIRYHKTTPLNTPIELFGENLRQDGRKQVSRGEMRVNGELTASAEGLFICAAPKAD
ncbi:MAG: PaaI family thioesterase [Halioglobus sp.]